jgi:hypothetical protein
MEPASAALVAAIVLALVYALRGGAGEGEFAERFWSRRRSISAAAGVSVAYVFVDVLPELAAYNHSIVEAAGSANPLFAEQRVYLLALASFVVLYGLEHFVLAARAKRGHVAAVAARDASYWLHVGGFALYSALIGYLLVERAERGHAALAVYALAMAVHFLVVDHSLAEAHGKAYRRGGHLWLAASVLAGWAVGAMMPLSELTLARLFAVLAGGIVITSLRAELPGEREGRFWPFVLGAALFAVLLLATAYRG